MAWPITLQYLKNCVTVCDNNGKLIFVEIVQTHNHDSDNEQKIEEKKAKKCLWFDKLQFTGEQVENNMNWMGLNELYCIVQNMQKELWMHEAVEDAIKRSSTLELELDSNVEDW